MVGINDENPPGGPFQDFARAFSFEFILVFQATVTVYRCIIGSPVGYEVFKLLNGINILEFRTESWKLLR